jgi:peptidoglycan hydrolase-like amidase
MMSHHSKGYIKGLQSPHAQLTGHSLSRPARPVTRLKNAGADNTFGNPLDNTINATVGNTIANTTGWSTAAAVSLQQARSVDESANDSSKGNAHGNPANKATVPDTPRGAQNLADLTTSGLTGRHPDWTSTTLLPRGPSVPQHPSGCIDAPHDGYTITLSYQD